MLGRLRSNRATSHVPVIICTIMARKSWPFRWEPPGSSRTRHPPGFSGRLDRQVDLPDFNVSLTTQMQ